MDILSTQVAALAAHNLVLAYLIVYGVTIFLGNIGAFVVLWVAFQGALGAWGVPSVVAAAAVANVTGDILWYWLGRGLRATRLGRWLRNRTPLYRRLGDRFETTIAERGPRWMLFAKFAYGTNFPILFSLGWSHFDFRRFFRRSLLAIALWLPIILGISYALFATLSPLGAAGGPFVGVGVGAGANAGLNGGIAALKHFELLFLSGLALFIILQVAIVKAAERFFGGE